jgi:hypothetical protein
VLGTLPAVLGEVAKPEGVLKALYSDLASPGVRQVGLLAQRRDAWLTEDGIYDPVIDKAKQGFPNIKNGEFKFSLTKVDEFADGDIVYNRGFIEILSYGRIFQQACID